MKTTSKWFSVVILCCATGSAFGGGQISVGNAAPLSPQARILAYPAITSLLNIFNEKFDGRCTTPTTDDVKVVCTGAIPPLPNPEIVESDCDFNLAIQCPGEVEVISGKLPHYIYDTTDANASVPAADGGVVIENITQNK